MLNDTHFAAAYDEDNVLRIFPLAGGADIGSGRLDVGSPLGVTKEFDLEGAARLGDRVYWIGSLGRNEEGDKEKPERRIFFATQIAGAGRNRLEFVGPPDAAAGQRFFQNLLAAPALSRFGLPAAAQLGAKVEGGLNIEGLAATRDGRLIIAFRNPLVAADDAGQARRALVVTLTNPGPVVESGAAPEFENGGTLQLGGRGIRAIEFVPSSGDYLIMAGAIDATRDFALYRWTGLLTDDPVLLSTEFGTLNPEGLALLPDGRLLVLSDDGTEQVDGRDCKHKDTPAERRSFRGRIQPLS